MTLESSSPTVPLKSDLPISTSTDDRRALKLTCLLLVEGLALVRYQPAAEVQAVLRAPEGSGGVSEQKEGSEMISLPESALAGSSPAAMHCTLRVRVGVPVFNSSKYVFYLTQLFNYPTNEARQVPCCGSSLLSFKFLSVKT